MGLLPAVGGRIEPVVVGSWGTRALNHMSEYRFTDYFLNEVLRKRPYLKVEWCIFTIENAVRSEPQESNRWRFWAAIPDIDDRYLRVVTLDDKLTIHNAFPDRGFSP